MIVHRNPSVYPSHPNSITTDTDKSLHLAWLSICFTIDSGEESALFDTEAPCEGAGLSHIVTAVFGLGLLCKVGGAGVYFTEQVTVTVESQSLLVC